MENFKDWQNSGTIKAGIALFVAGIYQITGIEILTEEMQQIILGLVTVIGSLVVIYRRYTATHKIKK